MNYLFAPLYYLDSPWLYLELLVNDVRGGAPSRLLSREGRRHLGFSEQIWLHYHSSDKIEERKQIGFTCAL